MAFLRLMMLMSVVFSVTLTPTSNSVEIDAPPSNQVVQISVSGGTASTGYIVVQAHAHLNNVTLSSSQSLTPGEFTTGYNIGVVVTPPQSAAYLRNSHNVTIPVLLMAQFYDTNGKWCSIGMLM